MQYRLGRQQVLPGRDFGITPVIRGLIGLIMHQSFVTTWQGKCAVFLAHLSRRLIGELIVYKGICLLSVRQHFQTTSPLKPRSRFFSYFTYSIYRSGERIIVFFCSGRIRTLVAMATYSSHRLMMGKRGN